MSCDVSPVPYLQEEGSQPQCCLCPVEGGALKPTTIPGLWCHAACMQWIPEVAVEDVSKMEPVTHIKSIQRERWELLCTICRCGPGVRHVCLCLLHPHNAEVLQLLAMGAAVHQLQAGQGLGGFSSTCACACRISTTLKCFLSAGTAWLDRQGRGQPFSLGRWRCCRAASLATCF